MFVYLSVSSSFQIAEFTTVFHPELTEFGWRNAFLFTDANMLAEAGGNQV
jgi:hypothetical protein